jgi:hypothetical protein
VIVPSTELAGVHLLMSVAGVEHVLGTPKSIRSIPDDDFDPPARVRRMDYGRTKVYLSATADGTVFSITTTDRRQKTSGGVGVGSSRASVARKVSGARCTARACVVGQERAGRRVTRFALSHGRVARVTLGFVVD